MSTIINNEKIAGKDTMEMSIYIFLKTYQTLVMNCILGGSKGYAAVSPHNEASCQ
jgi:hypothetical protein